MLRLFYILNPDCMKKPPFISFLFLLIFTNHKTFAQGGMQFTHTVPNYVELASTFNQQLHTTNTITVEAWCYLTTYSFLPTLVGNYGNNTMQFLLRIDNSRPAFWVEGGSGFRVVNGTTVVPLNTWTHLAGVWDGSALRVYINGVLDGTNNSVTGQFNNTTHPVRIGASLTSEAFSGSIDEVRIWSVARTQAQIQSTMNNCLQGSWSGLLASYSFEEGSGGTVSDRTGNGYNGTLVSSPSWTTGIGCVTLPVNFLGIATKAETDQVAVSWKVADELQILQYDIERSSTGSDFEKIGAVTADGSTEYIWKDVNPLPQQAYYRIKAVEASGVFKYSSVVRHAAVNRRNKILIAPNPVLGRELQLQMSQATVGRHEIRVMDASGRIFVKQKIDYTGGNSVISIPLPAELNAGVYLLMITDPEKKTNTERFMLQP